jgi:hypothetical protein
LEVLFAGIFRREWFDDSCESFSAWHEQVEQDRASFVQSHFDELEGPTACEYGGHHQFDWTHDEQNRTEGLRDGGSKHLSDKTKNLRRDHGNLERFSEQRFGKMELQNRSAKIMLFVNVILT